MQDAIRQGLSLSGAGTSSRYGLYMLPLVISPFCLLVVALFLLPTEWFSRHSGDVWLSGLGYGERLHGQNCQVLIYGDSSAEVGVDPAFIKSQTGLQACNIAQPESFLVVNGNVVLDHYLAHNTAPRVLVILFAPEAFVNPDAHMFSKVFEGITWRMGQPHKLQGIIQSMQVPENFFRWAYKGDHLVIRNILKPPKTLEQEHIREATLGRLPIDDLMMGTCLDSTHSIPPSREYIKDLRSRYTGANTTLLLDVMALPQCDKGFSVVQRQYQGLVDNKVEQLPTSVFYAEGRHVDRSGVAILSKRIADQVSRSLNADSRTGKQ